MLASYAKHYEELGYERAPELSADAVARLRAHGWPGNIRELRHVIKGAALRAGGAAVRVADLDLDRSGGGASARPAAPPATGEPLAGEASESWKQRLEAQERIALERTYQEAGGNLTRAAELFGVPRTTYREKLVRHGLLEH